MRESIYKSLPIVILVLVVIIVIQWWSRPMDKGDVERYFFQRKIDSINARLVEEGSRRIVLEKQLEFQREKNEELKSRPPEIIKEYVKIRTDYYNLTELGKDSAFAERLP